MLKSLTRRGESGVQTASSRWTILAGRPASRWRPIDALPDSALSIVVPVGAGDRSWRGLLPMLSELRTPFEVILSGCEPAPAELAAAGSAIQAPSRLSWLHGAEGRPLQLNAGIAAARGAQLWLLHADARPGAAVLREAGRPVDADTLAWFRLRFEPARPSLVRLNAFGANLRSRWLHLPFGDQGWRLTRGLVERIGQFDPAWSRGEDLEFAVRARQGGVRFRRFEAVLATSARRYADRGWWRTTVEHLRLTRSMWRKARRGTPT